ncbi:MAG: zf-HC2 domain-containing protein [Mariprofundus sp.]
MKQACHYASRLASDSLDRPLNLWERIRLKLHLSMCSNCQNCDNNLKLMRQINELMRINDYGHVRLSENQRKRLHQALDKKSPDE